MTLKELMEILSQLDQTKCVTIWNIEYGCTDYIDYVEVDDDGDLILF